MKLNIGRAENKYRYEACVSQIKKAFADYKEAFEITTEEDDELIWVGNKYELKESGEFVSLNSNVKNNILHLEKDVKDLQEFVYSEITKAKLDEEDEKDNEDKVDIDTLTIVKHCIESNVPNMKCFTLDIVGDDLYWVTKNSFTIRDANAFEEYVRRVFPYRTLWIIPKEFSTLDFEEDKNSDYMVSFEGEDEEEDSESALTTALSKLISVMKYLGVQEGIFKRGGIVIAALTDNPMKLNIRYNSTEIAVTLNEKTHKATYHCNSPSKKERTTDVYHITKVLEKYCDKYSVSDYEIVDVRNAETSTEDSEALFRLFVDILNS